MKRKAVLLLILGFLISTYTWGQQPLRVGFLLFPPFSVVDENNNLSGIAIERVVGILETLGIEYKANVYPARRLQMLIESGYIDFILGTKRNKSLYDHLHFSQKPYLSLKMMVYTTKGNQLPMNLKGLKGAVGVIRDYRYPGLYDLDKISIFAVNFHEQLFLMLTVKPKRLDYVIDYEIPATRAIKKHNISTSDIKARVLYHTPIYFCIRKNYPESLELLKRIEEINERLNPN